MLVFNPDGFLSDAKGRRCQSGAEEGVEVHATQLLTERLRLVDEEWVGKDERQPGVNLVDVQPQPA